MDTEVTREVFLNFSPLAKGIFYFLSLVATVIFFLGVWLKVRKYWRGRPDNRFQHLFGRIARAFGQYVGNRSVGRRNRSVGIAHTLIMWGFLTLFLGTVILTIDHNVMAILNPAWQFFHGVFYRWYSVILDILGAAFLIGLLFMAWRRGIAQPVALDYARPDLKPEETERGGYSVGDWLFLGLLFFLGVSGYLVEGLRIAGTGFPEFERWSPLGWWVAVFFDGVGYGGEAGLGLHKGMWWAHGVAALGFVAYLPFSKAVHLLVDGVNLAFKDPRAGVRLAPTEGGEDHLGQRDLEDFTWKQLLDFDACTKCGRCHVACPATAAGSPLSPRDLILDLRQHADASASYLAPGHERRPDLTYGDPASLVAGTVIRADTLWACTTCLACVEACPVGIEHVPTIVGMRRSLVDQGEIEPMLQEALMSLGKKGNSMGKSARQRARWTRGLPFKIKDARKERVRYLWFVGDFASFDPAAQETTRKVAKVLQAAEVDFGILYEGERNSGNDVRRVGEEGLFELLAEHNVGQLARAEFDEIFTTDPHSLNTLRNEYPEFGGDYPVLHYTELFTALLDSGELQLEAPVTRRVTYHDPCYLSRYNDLTEPPRQLLARLGATLVEMPRHGKNSFCCGAGGGRIWMDDSELDERPSENRIREALALEAITDFVVACPKDLVMYRAAVAATGSEDRLAVTDVIDLLMEAMGLEEDGPRRGARASRVA